MDLTQVRAHQSILQLVWKAPLSRNHWCFFNLRKVDTRELRIPSPVTLSLPGATSLLASSSCSRSESSHFGLQSPEAAKGTQPRSGAPTKLSWSFMRGVSAKYWMGGVALGTRDLNAIPTTCCPRTSKTGPVSTQVCAFRTKRLTQRKTH